jgi:hypothetical protein
LQLLHFAEFGTAEVDIDDLAAVQFSEWNHITKQLVGVIDVLLCECNWIDVATVANTLSDPADMFPRNN